MTDKIDDWYKLASYDNNLTSKLHANLLENNGIRVSTQVLSGIPGLNSGAVLWVQQADMAKAEQILESIAFDDDIDFDSDIDFDDDSENIIDN